MAIEPFFLYNAMDINVKIATCFFCCIVNVSYMNLFFYFVLFIFGTVFFEECAS